MDANVLAGYQSPAAFLEPSGWKTRVAAAFSFLRLHVQRRWRLFFGPYPLLILCTWVNRIGLCKNGRQMVGFLDKLREAAIEGELEFYGQMIETTGVQRQLTKISPALLRRCAISLSTTRAYALGGNEEIFTYDKQKTSKASQQTGHYCNLHVSRRVLRITRKIWEDAQS